MYEEKNIPSDRVIYQFTNTVNDARLGPGVALQKQIPCVYMNMDMPLGYCLIETRIVEWAQKGNTDCYSVVWQKCKGKNLDGLCNNERMSGASREWCKT